MMSFNISKAQENNYLKDFQLFKIQSSSVEEIRNFLSNERWNFEGARANSSFLYLNYPISYNLLIWNKQSYKGKLSVYNAFGKSNIVLYQTDLNYFNSLLKGFDSPKSETKIEEGKLIIVFSKGDLKIEFIEDKNNYSSSQYSILIYNKVDLDRELSIIKARDKKYLELKEEQNKKYFNLLEEGDKLYAMKSFALAKEKYLQASQINNSDTTREKIDSCEKEIFNELITISNNLITTNNYDSALSLFKNTDLSQKYKKSLDEQLRKTEGKILNQKLINLSNKAELQFNNQNFNLAKIYYDSILHLNNTDKVAIEKLNHINKINEILSKRKTTTFLYSLTNEKDFNKIKEFIKKDIGNLVNENENGYLKFNLLINFDTIGNNLSDIKIIESSNRKYSKYLENSNYKTLLKPSSLEGIFLSTNESLEFNFNWNTKNGKVISNSNGFFTKDFKEKDFDKIKNLSQKESFTYGKFDFEIKNVQINEVVNSNLKLINYKVVGPEAAFLSLLMPGLGTSKVSYRDKGLGRFLFFIVSSSLAVGSKIYSDSEYSKYLNATDQIEMNKYFANANLSHKVSLTSAGIAATIYVHDFFWVLSKGLNNKKKAKGIINQLKWGGISIQNEQILWQ